MWPENPARLILLASIALAVSALAGGVSPRASAAVAAPAQIPAQPEVSTSYYIDAQPTSNVLDELNVYGLDQANQDCTTYQGQPGNFLASSEFLDFGAQDVDGQETWSTAGVIGNPDTPQYTNSWIEQATENFAEGYDLGAADCDANNNNQELVSIEIYYGTNNDGDTPTASETTAQADAWTNIGIAINNAVASYVNSNSGTTPPATWVGPASDIEPGFSEPASTVESWTGEIATDYGEDVANNSLPAFMLNQANYGSADGCQTSNLTAASPCAPGWTTGDLEDVTDNALPNPQIYVSAAAEQWAAFCVYYDTADGSSPLAGVNILSDPAGSGFLSTSDSWNDINNDLVATGNSDCETEPPTWETTMENKISS